VATALAGAGLLAGGGKLRHLGVERVIAATGKEPKVHGWALVRHGDKPARKLYATGSALGLVGTAPLGVGTVETVRGRKVEKADDRKPLWREGLSGTKDALKSKGESIATPVPTKIRAAQLGVAGGAGWAGSALARAALRHHGGLKPLLGPVAGGLAGVASLPLSNKVVQHQDRGYVVTPAGVKRAKKPFVRASSKSSRYAAPPRSFRQDVGKAAGGVAAHFVYAQGPDDRPDGWSSHMGQHTDQTAGIPYPADKPWGRKGRMVVVDAMQREADRPTTRRGGVGLYGKIPLRGGKQWARDMQLDGEYAHAAAGGINPIRNVERDLLRARRAYLAPRVAGGAALVGAGALALRSRRKKKVAKAERTYQGLKTPYGVQRAAVTSARAVPVVGSIAGAKTAARYAPPGQERKAALRQYGMGTVAPLGIGVAGAYGGAHLAERTDVGHRAAQRVLDAKDSVHTAARSAVGLGEKKPLNPASMAGRTMQRAKASRIAQPWQKLSGRQKVGAAAGYLAVRSLSGIAGDQSAITLNRKSQQRYNARHQLSKSITLERGQSKREKHALAQRKRLNAGLSMVGGTAGLTGLALLPTRHKVGAVYAGTVASGIGGLNALVGSKVQRQEAHAIDPVKKATKDRLIFIGADGSRARARRVPPPELQMHPVAPIYADHLAYVGRRPLKGGRSIPEGRTMARAMRAQNKRKSGRLLPKADLDMESRSDYAVGKALGGARGALARHAQGAYRDARISRDLHLVTRAEQKRFPALADELEGQSQVYRATGTQARRRGEALTASRRVAKSLVPGRGYKPATELSALERRLVRVGHPHKVIPNTPDAPQPNRLPKRALVKGIGVRQVLGQHSKDRFIVADDNLPHRIVHRDRITFLKAWMPKEMLRDISNSPVKVTARFGDKAVGISSKQRRRAIKLYDWDKMADGPLSRDSVLRPKSGEFVRGGRRGGGGVVKRDDWKQSAPLKTSVSPEDAKKLIDRHGLKGPLPKHLDREQRRAAYEARYVTAGGRKAEHWQRRAIRADKVKTGGLAVATAAGVPWVASRTGAGRAVGRAIARHIPAARKVDSKRLAHTAETVAGAAATVGGAGELYAAHARRKRSSYASAPAGVAASALRRMQAYDRSS
jgi:hypothetical protein